MILPPGQILPEFEVIVGSGFTFTLTVSVFVQPFASVTVNTYALELTVVDVNETVGDATPLLLNPVVGLHE